MGYLRRLNVSELETTSDEEPRTAADAAASDGLPSMTTQEATAKGNVPTAQGATTQGNVPAVPATRREAAGGAGGIEREPANGTKRRKRRLAKRILIVVAIAVIALIGGLAWYVNDYYHADETARAAVADENGEADGVTVRELPSGAIAFVPKEPVAGLVFYPGAKVQPEAYAPLMTQCAERGILCVLVKPLFNFALLSIDAAGDATAQFPEINKWIIGGHSMGGVAASKYLSSHEADFAGISLLASYSTFDLTDFPGTALSVVGLQDNVLNWENYENAQSNLPRNEIVEIEGGNHGNFGNYGEQAGDGQATISREEQQARTADAIAALA